MESSLEAGADSTEPLGALDDAFVDHLAEIQLQLYNFIHSRLRNACVAEDVLQETNMVICQKSQQFEKGTNFKAWVFKIAHFQIMAQKKRWVRDKISYDGELLDILLEDDLGTISEDDVMEYRKDALEHCLDQLKPVHRSLVQRRYGDGDGVQKIAEELDKKCNAISQTLARIKQKLMMCIEQKLEDGKGA
jgi:RNA polymerase sigma-70 factor (ECF subfamily)